MQLGTEISHIRKREHLTQEAFGELFHVTRQTVSNWENGKSYPDLQTLIHISNRFSVSLDTLLKEDSKMVQTIDRERMTGILKHSNSITDVLLGTGVALVVSSFFYPNNINRAVVILIGIAAVGIGWYKKAKLEQSILAYLQEHEE